MRAGELGRMDAQVGSDVNDIFREEGRPAGLGCPDGRSQIRGVEGRGPSERNRERESGARAALGYDLGGTMLFSLCVGIIEGIRGWGASM